MSLLVLLGVELGHVLEATHLLVLLTHHVNHLGSLVELGVMLAELWSLPMLIVLLLDVTMTHVLIAFFDGEKYFTASVAQL